MRSFLVTLFGFIIIRRQQATGSPPANDPFSLRSPDSWRWKGVFDMQAGIIVWKVLFRNVDLFLLLLPHSYALNLIIFPLRAPSHTFTYRVPPLVNGLREVAHVSDAYSKDNYWRMSVWWGSVSNRLCCRPRLEIRSRFSQRLQIHVSNSYIQVGRKS